MDQAGMIRAQDEAELETWLQQAKASGLAQVQVLTVPNLQGESIEQASIQIAEKWKLGSEKGDNGVLILVAQQERKVRIEVGQGLEGVIPDITAKRIVSDVMIPIFQQGDFSQGILAGSLAVLNAVDPNQSHEQYLEPSPQRSEGLPKRFYLILFIAIMLVILRGGGGGRRRYRGGFIGGLGGLGGFGGRGGFGGGGWSGGGGGFSGGGASGGW